MMYTHYAKKKYDELTELRDQIANPPSATATVAVQVDLQVEPVEPGTSSSSSSNSSSSEQPTYVDLDE